ncbi:MAG: glycolate oxidase subunit GlcE [Gammaproteobacteria bacterium]|nr:glycolate oxidase subunit GlcE [Gammaproteobacteria bacterium]
MTDNLTESIQEQVKDAYYSSRALKIMGNSTKEFLGHPVSGEPLEISGHTGIVNYEPTELVITARSGTTLNQIEQALNENNQMLAFEPPHFGEDATLGGAIACGLSGPGRARFGAVRDFVLGTRIINGQGDLLHFGGEVMKNVAGYDLSRLQAGAMGTLGVLLEVSLKVLPKEDYTRTQVLDVSKQSAFEKMCQCTELPASATAYVDDRLYIRLSGSENTINSISTKIGGELLDNDAAFWLNVREHQHPFFRESNSLWRLSVPPATPPIDLPGQWLIEWNGAQRWLNTDANAKHIRTIIEPLGGHATCYHSPLHSKEDEHEIFHPLPEPLMKLHHRLKYAMDPNGIFNPGKMYPGL